MTTPSSALVAMSARMPRSNWRTRFSGSLAMAAPYSAPFGARKDATRRRLARDRDQAPARVFSGDSTNSKRSRGENFRAGEVGGERIGFSYKYTVIMLFMLVSKRSEPLLPLRGRGKRGFTGMRIARLPAPASDAVAPARAQPQPSGGATAPRAPPQFAIPAPPLSQRQGAVQTP